MWFGFSAALIFGVALNIFAQHKPKTVTQSISFGDSRQKIVDLTTSAKKKCTVSIQKEAGENTVLIKFQPEYREEAEEIAEKLADVLIETQKIVAPFEIEDIKFYLLQMDSVPINYKISEVVNGEKFYLDLFVFESREDINSGVCKPSKICSQIFSITPHELTHTALEDLITREKTRWFDDGLAEYVGNTVYERLSPDNYRKEDEGYLPLVSLHRREIRVNIFSWREPTSAFLHKSRSELSREVYYYPASYQLIKEIITGSEKKGVKNPLSLLLTTLKEHREKSANLVSTDEIISIIRQYLKVDPRAVGELDGQTQQILFDEAISLLSADAVSSKNKNKALYILAGIDGIVLSVKWIDYLLDQVYKPKTKDEQLRELAAAALVVRVNQADFGELLGKYLAANSKLKRKSLTKAKAELVRLSIRPRPD